MIRASAHQETEANLYLAQFYDKGVNGSLFVVFNCTSICFLLLIYFREPDWRQASEYYEKYIHIRENESNNIDEDSGTHQPSQTKSNTNGISFHDQHDIVARLATLYKTGGYNLLCNYRKAGNVSFFFQ
jgi:hypothetical protein